MKDAFDRARAELDLSKARVRQLSEKTDPQDRAKWTARSSKKTVGWSEALEAIHELHEATRGEAFQAAMHGQLWIDGKIDGAQPQHNVPIHPMARSLAATIRRLTSPSVPVYWVSRDMVAMIHAAGLSMPPQVLKEADAPGPHGVVVFESPIDRSNTEELPLRGFLWARAEFGPSSAGFCLSSINDAPLMQIQLMPESIYARPFGIADNVDLIDGGSVDEGVAVNHYRLPYAAWTIFGQRLARIDDVQVQRQARKRMQKSGRAITTVRRVQLRKSAAGIRESNGGTSEYSHRWLVSGHWRNQWLPSRQTHRLQWILPYVKGPEDKPFVAKEQVYKLVR